MLEFSSSLTRWMALDVGSKTIGIAITDPLKLTAQPLVTLSRKNLASDARRVCYLIDQHQVERLIVGIPRHLGGERSAEGKMIEPLAKRIEQLSSLPVERAEERLSTKEAERLMAEAGFTSAQRRKRRNEVSAAVILKWYLEERS